MAGNLMHSKSSESLQVNAGMVPALPDESAYAMPAPEPEAGVPWSRYVAALKRYKWLILLVTLVGTGLGLLATRFMKPEYTVYATIWVESPPESEGPIRANTVVEGNAWIELLRTFAIVDEVVQRERLYLEPASPGDSLVFQNFGLARMFAPGSYVLNVAGAGRRWTLETSDGQSVEAGAVGDSIGRKVGFAWAPAAAALGRDREIEFAVSSPRDASNALMQSITPQMGQDGNFLRLSMTGTDPRRITRTMNSLIETFVSEAAVLKKSKLTETAKILEEQLATTGEALREAEGRLGSYQVGTITQPSQATPLPGGIELTQKTVISDFFGKKMQADAIEQDRLAILSTLRRVRQGELAVDAFAMIPAVKAAPAMQEALAELAKADAEVRTLRQRYTDSAPQVKQALQRVATLRNQTIPTYAGQLATDLLKVESGLNAQISAQSRELQEIPGRTITEQRLLRERDQAAALYEDVAKRHHAARLAEASAIPDVKVLDPAVQPDRPSSNSAPRIIMMAFLASFGLAIGIAILLDQLDKRFRYPDQVTRELGLSILGAIPQIRKLKPGERDAEEASQVVEAFRTVRMNLVHSYGAAGPVLLTITSPGAGDGKSLVSSNLALSFAEAGYRTLLIDGDIRRGELHRMFSTERRPGLLDQLVGQVSLEQVLRPTTHKNLTLMPCGTRHQHGPELLGSSSMRELMAVLKTRYNVVIIDSPPLGAGIDPFVLGTATGHMMLVLRSGETDRQMAEAKLKLVDRLPVRMLGAVLNDIQTSGVYKYYAYIYGYTADEEPSGRLAAGAAAGGGAGDTRND